MTGIKIEDTTATCSLYVKPTHGTCSKAHALALSLLLVFVCRFNGVLFNLCVFFNRVFFGMSPPPPPPPHDKTFLCFWGKCRIQ